MTAYPAYCLWLVLSVCFAGLDAGSFPLRGAILLLLLPWCFYRLSFCRHADAPSFLRSPYLWVSVCLIFISLLLQLSTQQELPVYCLFLLRYLVQPLILALVLIAMFLAQGGRRVMLPFILLVCVSALFALLQSNGVDWSWNVRRALGGWQEEGGAAVFYINRDRPMGLSLNPVQLGYQCLVALVCACHLRRIGAVNDAALAVVPLLMGGIVASGLRSAFLGAVLFLTGALFLLPLGRLLRVGGLALALALGCFGIWEFLDERDAPETALRIADYRSATDSRVALNAYSLLLFLEKPAGRGLGFDSRGLARDYLGELSGMKNRDAVRTLAPHNAVAVFANAYGVAGLCALAAYLLLVTRKGALLALGLAAYLLNSFFHNAGLFVGDYFVLFLLIPAELMVEPPKEAPLRPVNGSKLPLAGLTGG